MPKQSLQPVALQERIQTIDIIRGFALFGVLVINFTVDNRNIEPQAGWTGIADQLTYWPIRFLMDDKFMATYCFLFGLGFSIQMLRAEARKSPFVFVYTRRLFVLYLIGVIHQILTYESILPSYAVVGFVLLLLHKLPKKLLPILAILCFLIPTARDFFKSQKAVQSINSRTVASIDSAILDKYVGVYQGNIPHSRVIFIRKKDTLIGVGPSSEFILTPLSDTHFIRTDFNWILTFKKDSTGTVDGVTTVLPDGNSVTSKKVESNVQQELKELLQQRTIGNSRKENITYKQFIVKNASEFWQSLKNLFENNFKWGFNIDINITSILPLFLMGLYFGRRKIFYDISSNRHFLFNMMKWGLLIGFTGVSINLGFEAWNFIKDNNWNSNSYSILTRTLIDLSWNLGVMILALGYIAGFTLLLDNVNWKKRLSFLAPVGRMGLTNYLFQTIPYIFLFESFGVGLSGKIGPFWRLMLALPVFIIIIFISSWWFKHFRIGPAEWLWRSITYWKIQPIRLNLSDKSKEKENGNI